uniref:Uncharacterized protein n=1 Tax=Panagrolaimus davidi TaxID=227884 RepID=A0A914Q850_9BILA
MIGLSASPAASHETQAENVRLFPTSDNVSTSANVQHPLTSNNSPTENVKLCSPIDKASTSGTKSSSPQESDTAWDSVYCREDGPLNHRVNERI